MEEQSSSPRCGDSEDAVREEIPGSDVRSRRLTISVKAKSKARPRMSKNGHVYTDKATSAYERYIRDQWRLTYGASEPFSGALAVTLTFRYQRPKSHYLKGELRETAPKHYTQTPDLDNIEKAVLDGLNKVAYVDDKQICRKYTEKEWHDSHEIEVWVSELC